MSEPKRQRDNVDTWKLKVTTRPEQSNLPMQRINIDICAIPSYEPKPMMLLNHYGTDMGTSGLILQAESREEILANKLVALALCPNRIKNRDLWDITWLRQQTVELPLPLLVKKIADHRQTTGDFLELLEKRLNQIKSDDISRESFIQEMHRFLPPVVAKRTVESGEFWQYLCMIVTQQGQRVLSYLTEGSSSDDLFKM